MNYLQKKKQAIIMMLAAQIVKTAQGYPVTVNDCESGTAVDYTVWGNTVADGDTVMYVGDKTKNLIPYPYHESTKTVNGITFTDNGDGSITVNGTATNTTFCHLVPMKGTNALKLSAAKYYFSDNCNSSSSPRRFLIQAKKRVNSGWTNLLSMEGGNGVFDITKLECDCIWVVLAISAGDAFDNVTFKPQLELGGTVTKYEPYRVPVTANIYLDEPLKNGESINFGADNLPGLQLFEGSNVITADTVVKPEKISVDYYEKG